MPARLLLAALLLAACPASADTVRNDGRFAAGLFGGPGTGFALQGSLPPGAVAELGQCEAGTRWCIASTGSAFGWVDVTQLTILTAAPRPSGIDLYGRAPLAPPSSIVTEALPGASDLASSDPLADPRARPLPGAILDAVGAGGAAIYVPGAAPPLIFSDTVPFRNVTDGLVNLRAGPGAQTAIVGELRPGEGGRIDLCDAAQAWCRIAPGGRPAGWVKMTLVGLRRM